MRLYARRFTPFNTVDHGSATKALTLRWYRRPTRRIIIAVGILAILLVAAGTTYYAATLPNVNASSSTSSSTSKLSSSTSTGTPTQSSTTSLSSTTSSSTSSTSEPLPAVFPRSDPPGVLYVVDVNRSNSLGYELAALQGIVARTQPRLFLVNQPDDLFWLKYTTSKYGLSYQNSTSAQVLQMFKGEVSNSDGKVRIVLYDGNDVMFPTQLDMAKTLAGVYSALPVSSNDLPAVQSIFGADNLVIVRDLSGLFSDKVSAYTWLWTKVGQNVTTSFLTISPSGRLGLTDYEVEFKSFVFEFGTSNPLTTDQTQLAESILGNYPQMTPVLGFFGLGGESSTVSFLSQRQMLMIPGDEVMDLSVYSGLPEAINLKQAPPQSNLSYEPSKTYVLFSFSQGNALGFDFYANRDIWAQQDAAGHYLRAEIPKAWQINPLAAELAPPMIQYYYQTMTPNDSFYGGASGGAGYVHPDQLPNLSAYLSLAKTVNSNLGIGVYFIVPAPTSQWLSTIYQSYISATNPEGILLKQPRVPPQLVSGVPVMPVTLVAPKSSVFSSTDVTSTVDTLEQLSGSNRFIFVFMDAKNPGLQFISDVVQGLGPSFVPVRVDQFVALFSESVAGANVGPFLPIGSQGLADGILTFLIAASAARVYFGRIMGPRLHALS